MRVFVAGQQGQVALALARALPAAGHEVFALDLPQLDLTQRDSVAAAFAGLPWRPDLVVNAAAYTAVDKAEDDAATAFLVNADGAGWLAAGAAALGAPFIHFSTDYVFDGAKGTPYVETDPPCPVGVYGASKLAGEQAVLAANPRSVILRTAWVCSADGNNFLRTMLRLARDGRAELGVVADQQGAPTFAADLAEAVCRLAPNMAAQGSYGVFHLTGAPHTSWHGFAEAIFAGLTARGERVPQLRAITTADYPTKARRPADGRLDCTRIGQLHGIPPADWRQSLEIALALLAGVAPLSGTAVLLATYNGAAYLPEQLASLGAQIDPDWRLLWRDDGSTDGTLAVMNEFRGATRLAEPAGRLGVLRGFMTLLAAAPEDAARFAFCDQDDVWRPDKLARAAAALPEDRPALYCARQQLVDGSLRPIGLSPLPRRPPGFGNALVQNIATGCTLVLNAAARRAVLATIPPASTLHDWWCYLVVTGIGGLVVYDPEPALLYRQHDSNAVGATAAFPMRARRALRRGTTPFLAALNVHLAALERVPDLTADARRTMDALRGLVRAGPLGRLARLRRAGVYRQSPLEDVLLQLWIAFGRFPER